MGFVAPLRTSLSGLFRKLRTRLRTWMRAGAIASGWDRTNAIEVFTPPYGTMTSVRTGAGPQTASMKGAAATTRAARQFGRRKTTTIRRTRGTAIVSGWPTSGASATTAQTVATRATAATSAARPILWARALLTECEVHASDIARVIFSPRLPVQGAAPPGSQKRCLDRVDGARRASASCTEAVRTVGGKSILLMH